MREVSSKEAQELKAESLFVLGELEDFDRYPMRVHKTGKGIFIESLRVDEDHPHVFFDDPI